MLQSCDKGMSMFPERQKCLSLGPPRNNLPCRTKHHIIIYTHVLQYSVHRPSLCDRDVESWGKRGDLEDDRTFSIISAMVSDMTRGIHTSNDVGVSQIARVIPSQENIALSLDHHGNLDHEHAARHCLGCDGGDVETAHESSEDLSADCVLRLEVDMSTLSCWKA